MGLESRTSGAQWRAPGISALFVAALVAVAACGQVANGRVSAPIAQARAVAVNLTVDGLARNYRVYMPPNLAATPVPVVLALHGATQDALGMEKMTLFDDEADARGFVIAYPNGIGRTWNAGLCCSATYPDDVKFLNAVINDIKARRAVDTNRVFMTGFSNGGQMTSRFACMSPSSLRAFALVDSRVDPTCTPNARLSMLAVHGLKDTAVPFGGVVGFVYPSVINGVVRTATADGCGPTPAFVRVGTVNTYDWPGCQGGTKVRLITDDNGTHSWMGAPTVFGQTPPPVTEVKATPTVASFFMSL